MEGLKNFIVGIKPIMLKLKNGEKLAEWETKQIVQFYLETVAVVSQQQ